MTYRQPFEGDWPITQKYGEAITSSFHTGIDYGCPEGTIIVASNDGVVKMATTENNGYGNYVIIQHNDGQATLYAHLKLFIVKPGQTVKQSQMIGYSGSTGNSTGPHLHFEARKMWYSYTSHFNPKDLPLMSFYQPAVKPDISSGPVFTKPEFIPPVIKLKEASDLGKNVKVVASSGVRAFDENYVWQTNFSFGTELEYTGNSKVREDNGLTYCEVVKKFWVAVHDEDTQILDNNSQK